MQDRIYRIIEIFLHRTAGPYIWVIFDRFAGACGPVDVGFTPKAPNPSQDQARCVWPDACDPNSEMGGSDHGL